MRCCDDAAMLRWRNEHCIIYESVSNCDCNARANPTNQHCIIYENVSNCDCTAMKIAALAHRSLNWKLSFRELAPLVSKPVTNNPPFPHSR
jgi:hypothetical protein